MRRGISIKERIGIGDGIQFSSLPENYFRTTGEKLIDVSKPWFFDHNPFVERSGGISPEVVTEMWNFSPKQYSWPRPRHLGVYHSNAEIHAAVLNCPVKINRPRLYQFEDYPFERREAIILHTHGKSHGAMPDEIVDHVVKKYRPTGCLVHLCLPDDPDLGVARVSPADYWALSEYISKSRMLIGMDSGPSWIAACFPDVVVKKIRTKPTPEHFTSWTPLEVDNIHSHWDDRIFQIHNPTKEDIGFTASYLRL